MSHYTYPEDVAALDELLMKGDAWPTTRPIMTMVLVLARPPEAGRLEAAFERAIATVPRMRQRVATSAWNGRRPVWVDDEAFHASHHVTRVGAPGDGSLESAIQWAGTGSTRPFDPARPLWDAVLVERLVDGRALIVIRAHHAIADGVRSIQMMAALLTLEPTAGPETDEANAGRPGTTLFSGPGQMLRAITRNYADAAVRTLGMSRVAFHLGTRPITTVGSANAYVRSALRTLDRGKAAPSPLLSARSGRRSFATLELPLEAVQAVARSHGATVNDVYLTALLGGLRSYHETLGHPAADIPFAIPIDVSGGDAHDAGNHISAAIFPGPSSIEDPVTRLRTVHDLVASRRAERGLGALEHLAPALRQVPPQVALAAVGAHARRVDFQASNLVGPPFPVYLAGEKVERMFAFGPLPGLPAMAVLVSYDGLATIGFTIDPAAVTDSALLVECVREALAELCRAGT